MLNSGISLAQFLIIYTIPANNKDLLFVIVYPFMYNHL